MGKPVVAATPYHIATVAIVATVATVATVAIAATVAIVAIAATVAIVAIAIIAEGTARKNRLTSVPPRGTVPAITRAYC